MTKILKIQFPLKTFHMKLNSFIPMLVHPQLVLKMANMCPRKTHTIKQLCKDVLSF